MVKFGVMGGQMVAKNARFWPQT